MELAKRSVGLMNGITDPVLTCSGWAGDHNSAAQSPEVSPVPLTSLACLLLGPNVVRLISLQETVMAGSSAIVSCTSCWCDFKSQIFKQKLK